MPLPETDYCLEQINVPPKLPTILKQFCKSAIRTQPYDLLKWSSAYFHALANGEEPPTKLRLEYPPASTAHGLTLGFLKVLLRQLGADYNKVIPLQKILDRWGHLCLETRDSDMIIRIGKFSNKCQIKKFLAIGVGLLTRNITETMIMICQLFTHEPDGGSAMIPFALFMDIYGYLADLRCDGAEKGNNEICLCPVKSRSLEPPSKAKPEFEVQPESVFKSEAAAAVPESRQEPLLVTIGPTSSQDTDADFDFEYESYSKEDIQSRMTLQSFGEETEESFLHEGEASFELSDRTESTRSRTSEIVEKPETKKEESMSSDSETKKEIQSPKSISYTSKKSGAEMSLESSEQSSHSSDSFTNYPCVPGIGRQLLAEEVTTVAIWMAECARRQEGIVGPRNIRHINCPPLTGTCCALTSSSSSLFTDT